MKKLMTLMLGLGLAIGGVTVTFAQDTKQDSGTPKKKKGKKKKTGDGTTQKSHLSN